MPFKKGQKPHNFKDLTGEKRNMLTVKSLFEIKNNISYWSCECDCGKEKILSIKDLQNTKSCGCLKKVSRKEDLTDYENDDIIVVSFQESRKGQSYWNCKCKKCGKIIQRCSSNIKNGLAVCKCVHYKRVSEEHKKFARDTRLYSIWIGIRNRCFNSNDASYEHYGKRGITICDEWNHNFETFYYWALSNGYNDELSIERKNVNGNYCPENCCWIKKSEQAKNKTNTIYATLNGETKRLIEWCEILNLNQKTVYNRIYNMGLSPEAALVYKRKRGG